MAFRRRPREARIPRNMLTLKQREFVKKRDAKFHERWMAVRAAYNSPEAKTKRREAERRENAIAVEEAKKLIARFWGAIAKNKTPRQNDALDILVNTHSIIRHLSYDRTLSSRRRRIACGRPTLDAIDRVFARGGIHAVVRLHIAAVNAIAEHGNKRKPKPKSHRGPRPQLEV